MILEVTHAGETKTVDIDLRLDKMSLQESVRLEEAIGEEKWDKLMDSGSDETIVLRSPKVIRAVVWAKLATVFPGLGYDDFDLDFGEMAEVFPQPLTMPMATPDGETTVAEMPATGTEGGRGNG